MTSLAPGSLPRPPTNYVDVGHILPPIALDDENEDSDDDMNDSDASLASWMRAPTNVSFDPNNEGTNPSIMIIPPPLSPILPSTPQSNTVANLHTGSNNSNNRNPSQTTPNSSNRVRRPPRPASTSNAVAAQGVTTSFAGNQRRMSRSQSSESISGNESDNSGGSSISNSRLMRRSRPMFKSLRKEGKLLEKLFGDVVPSKRNQRECVVRGNSRNITNINGRHHGNSAIRRRSLMASSVYHNQVTNIYIVTLDTSGFYNRSNMHNNSRSNNLKGFSFPTEQEAKKAAQSYAPPRMIPFSSCPTCYICKGKFAVFRRAGHCRNCGVCVCTQCCTHWPAKMIPETYNMKKAGSVKICKSCDSLSSAFQKTLLEGKHDEAIALYRTGNINLRCPFKKYKGDHMFPIHCAVTGGSLSLLQWLVDKQFCPIYVTRTGNNGNIINKDLPILTSKGRSLIDIAMYTSGTKVPILRYLVVEKKMSIYEVKDVKVALGALEATLKKFPLPAAEDGSGSGSNNNSTSIVAREDGTGTRRAGNDFTYPDENNSNVSNTAALMHLSQYETMRCDGAIATSAENAGSGNGVLNTDDANIPEVIETENVDNDNDDDVTVTTVADACIICYENSIDCVMTPCGHQICCMDCSANLKVCPVCNMECTFMRIFRM